VQFASDEAAQRQLNAALNDVGPAGSHQSQWR
jgi:hypothetical protein